MSEMIAVKAVSDLGVVCTSPVNETAAPSRD